MHALPGVTLTQDFPARPDQVYAAFTHPVYLRRWLCDYAIISGNIDVEGGEYLFTWENGYSTSGRFTARIPFERVSFTSISEHDPGGVMTIEVQIASVDAGTRVTLTQRDIPESVLPETIEQGWRVGFEHLAYFLDTGLNLRRIQASGGVKPTLYPDKTALADALRRERVHLAHDLDTLLTGVTDAEAARRPAPDEWSVNEHLAHLVHSERHTQLSVYGTIGGGDQFAWPDNNMAQLTPILTACPTLADLRAELQRAWDGSVGQIAALPDAAVGDNLMFTAITLQWGWGGEHTYEHFEYMRAAIAAVRAAT
jgi:uncharacterized protein YndB with AHSA1/START domain